MAGTCPPAPRPTLSTLPLRLTWRGRSHLSLMSSQRGDEQFLCGPVPLPPEGVVAGRRVVKLVWGQCGLEGSFTTHWSAATSQSAMTSPLGSMQSSAVLLVQVPVGEKAQVEPARALGPPRSCSPASPVTSCWPGPRWLPAGAKPRTTATGSPSAGAGEPRWAGGARADSAPSPCPGRAQGPQGALGARLTALALGVVAKQAIGQLDGEGQAIVGDQGAQPGDVHDVVDARLVHLQPVFLVGQCHGLLVDQHLWPAWLGSGTARGQELAATQLEACPAWSPLRRAPYTSGPARPGGRRPRPSTPHTAGGPLPAPPGPVLFPFLPAPLVPG